MTHRFNFHRWASRLRRFALLLPVAALLCSVGPLANAQAAAADANKSTLRVMSFNIRLDTRADGENQWSNRREQVVETIQAFQPDLLGLQEVVAHQGDYLIESLPEYEHLGVGRDDGKRRGEFSSLMYKKDRFERLDHGHFWLSTTPEVPGSKSWDTSITRMVTWAKLRDRHSGQTLVYLNTHWDHRGAQARLESAKLMRDWIAQHAADLPVIITGDFNTTEDIEPYQVLTAAGLRDSYRVVHPERSKEEATFNGFRGNVAGSRIDWILHSAHFQPQAADIVRTNRDGRYPSDHYPVTAVLIPAEK